MTDNPSPAAYQGNILVVDDEPNAIKVLSAILREAKFKVFEALNVEKAIEVIRREEIDTVITDLKMPERDGTHLFDYISDNYPDIPTIFLTAFGSVDSAVQAMTRGAFYYFIKPPDYIELKNILLKAVEQKRLKSEIQDLKKRLADKQTEYRIIGNSQGMQHIFQTIETIKDSTSSVLITGDTGVGKELVARALHFGSIRRDKPFVAMNCAAVPEELVESELFGYEKGSFTGAVSQRIGKFEEASSGTIFLDEIGELGITIQAKLLRVLQEKEIVRIGSNKKIPVDFRLISSTNRNLADEISQGDFREDLFYRINVVPINIPSLRERRDDIPLLFAEFIREFCEREKKVLSFSPDLVKILQNYDWAGNVRELRNVIERAVLLAQGAKITIRDFPEEFASLIRKGRSRQQAKPLKETVREREAETIRESLKDCNDNKSEVARRLRISRKALYKKLKELNIS